MVTASDLKMIECEPEKASPEPTRVGTIKLDREIEEIGNAKRIAHGPRDAGKILQDGWIGNGLSILEIRGDDIGIQRLGIRIRRDDLRIRV